jgi:hypothetical protein
MIRVQPGQRPLAKSASSCRNSAEWPVNRPSSLKAFTVATAHSREFQLGGWSQLPGISG